MKITRACTRPRSGLGLNELLGGALGASPNGGEQRYQYDDWPNPKSEYVFDVVLKGYFPGSYREEVWEAKSGGRDHAKPKPVPDEARNGGKLDAPILES